MKGAHKEVIDLRREVERLRAQRDRLREAADALLVSLDEHRWNCASLYYNKEPWMAARPCNCTYGAFIKAIAACEEGT